MNYFELRIAYQLCTIHTYLKTSFDKEVIVFDYLYSLNTIHKAKALITSVLFSNKYRLVSKENFTGILCIHREQENELIQVAKRYFAAKPEAINLSTGGCVYHRKESFDNWRNFISRHVLFSKNIALTIQEIGHHVHVPSTALSMKRLEEMLFMFMKPEWEIMTHPSISTKASLPLVDHIIRLNQLTNEWLLAITWYTKIANDLVPLLAKMKSFENEKHKSKLLLNFHSVLKECQNLNEILLRLNIYDDSIESKCNLEEVFFLNFIALMNFKICEDFQFLNAESLSTIFLRAMLDASANYANEAIAYLLDKQKNVGASKKYDDSILKSVTLSILRQFYRTIKIHFKKQLKIFNKFNEKDILCLIFQKVANLLKIYVRDFPNIGLNDLALYRQKLEKSQLFIIDIICEVGFTIMASISESFHVLIEGKETMLRQVSILLTTEAVLGHIRESKFSTHVQLRLPLIQMTGEIQDKIAQIPVFHDIVKNMQVIVNKAFWYAMLLMSYRNEKPNSLIITASIMYEDFPFYLKGFSNTFMTCPHPLSNMNYLSYGKL